MFLILVVCVTIVGCLVILFRDYTMPYSLYKEHKEYNEEEVLGNYELFLKLFNERDWVLEKVYDTDFTLSVKSYKLYSKNQWTTDDLVDFELIRFNNTKMRLNFLEYTKFIIFLTNYIKEVNKQKIQEKEKEAKKNWGITDNN